MASSYYQNPNGNGGAGPSYNGHASPSTPHYYPQQYFQHHPYPQGQSSPGPGPSSATFQQPPMHYQPHYPQQYAYPQPQHYGHYQQHPTYPFPPNPNHHNGHPAYAHHGPPQHHPIPVARDPSLRQHTPSLPSPSPFSHHNIPSTPPIPLARSPSFTPNSSAKPFYPQNLIIASPVPPPPRTRNITPPPQPPPVKVEEIVTEEKAVRVEAAAAVLEELQPPAQPPIDTPPPASVDGGFMEFGVATGYADLSSSLPSSQDPSSAQSPRNSSWVVWSSRPQDPSLAPGIIFSSRSGAPQSIVESAIPLPAPSQTDLTTPGKSKSKRRGLPRKGAVHRGETSLDQGTAFGDAVAGETDVAEASTEAAPSDSQTASAVVEPTTAPSPAERQSDAPAPVSSTPSDTTNTTTESPAAVAPAAPATPTVPPPKKSWASLLKPASVAPSAALTPGNPTAGPRKSIPTSAVIGISISASTPLASPTPSVATTAPTLSNGAPFGGVTAAQRDALVNLLSGQGNRPKLQTTSDIKARGLINNGNMCFANSVLQVLLYCEPFHALFGELGQILFPLGTGFPGLGEKKSANGNGSGRVATPLVDATIEFLREFDSSPGPSRLQTPPLPVKPSGKGKQKAQAQPSNGRDDDEAFVPSCIYEAIRGKKRFDGMRGGQQEDAEEFLGFYLDTLEEELLALLSSLTPDSKALSVSGDHEDEVEEPQQAEDGWLEVGKKNRSVGVRTIKSSTGPSPITRIFGGKFRSTLRFKGGGQRDSVVVEDWRALGVDITKPDIETIDDAVSAISAPQSITMPRPGSVPVEASQQVLIDRDSLPPVLVLHVKRFDFATNLNVGADTALGVPVGGVVKIMKKLRFGRVLTVSQDVLSVSKRSPPQPTGKPSKPSSVQYKLVGAIYHHGVSASGGHYTLDVLHSSGSETEEEKDEEVDTKERWLRIDDESVANVKMHDVFVQSENAEERSVYLMVYRRI